jgi:hypothetical protein
MTPKRMRKAIRRMQKDAVRWRVAEHLVESGLVVTPTNAIMLAGMILDDIRPMIRREVLDELAADDEPNGPGEYIAPTIRKMADDYGKKLDEEVEDIKKTCGAVLHMRHYQHACVLEAEHLGDHKSIDGFFWGNPQAEGRTPVDDKAGLLPPGVFQQVEAEAEKAKANSATAFLREQAEKVGPAGKSAPSPAVVTYPRMAGPEAVESCYEPWCGRLAGHIGAHEKQSRLSQQAGPEANMSRSFCEALKDTSEGTALCVLPPGHPQSKHCASDGFEW